MGEVIRMDREKFIKELSFLLQDIADEDREDALYYYEDYFAEAGKENEEKVIRELQSPERVAAIIKAGLNSSFEDNIEYSESSMKNSGYDKPDEIVVNSDKKETKEKKEGYRSYKETKKSGFQGNPDRNRVLLIAIIVMVAIFGLPFFGAGFGILFAVFMVLFCLGFVFAVAGVAVMAVAGVLIIKGLTLLSTTLGAGLISIGAGVLCIALALLLFMNVKWPFKIVPNIFRGIINTIRSIVSKVGEKL